eukprot:GGOE01045271.1.p1 GENE.GGOE01045271.1~~GGOE01045271.1.p1  ORF type:complete len:505 (-),score=104.47 GGOE01045271.1:231-1724(-)
MSCLRWCAAACLLLVSFGQPSTPAITWDGLLHRDARLVQAIEKATAHLGAFTLTPPTLLSIASKLEHPRCWQGPGAGAGRWESLLSGGFLRTTVPCPALLNNSADSPVTQHGACPAVEDTCGASGAAAEEVRKAYRFAGLPWDDRIEGRNLGGVSNCQMVRTLAGASAGRLAAPLTCPPQAFIVVSSPVVFDFATAQAADGLQRGLQLERSNGERTFLDVPPGAWLVLDCDRVSQWTSVTVGVAENALQSSAGMALAWCSHTIFGLARAGDSFGATHHRQLATTVRTGFCNADVRGVTMWMNGFTMVGDPGNPCVSLLFPQWLLKDAGVFAGACFGVFVLAIVIEGIVSLRRWVRNLRPRTKGRAMCGHGALLLLLYGINVTLGYFLMLIAMIYQVELFLMVIFGLIVGQAIFHTKWKLPAPRSQPKFALGLSEGEENAAPQVVTCCRSSHAAWEEGERGNATPCCSPAVEPAASSVIVSEDTDENQVMLMRSPNDS